MRVVVLVVSTCALARYVRARRTIIILLTHIVVVNLVAGNGRYPGVKLIVPSTCTIAV